MEERKQFGTSSFNREEIVRIQSLLAKRIPKHNLATRAGPGGRKLTYLESYRAIELANEIFEYNGWSCSIISSKVDYLEQVNNNSWSCCVTAVVQVTLKDGTYHQDIGIGSSDKMKSKNMALEKAQKEAISDGRKRALRLFGNGLGNCVYNRTYVNEMARGKATPYDPNYSGPRYNTETNYSSGSKSATKKRPAEDTKLQNLPKRPDSCKAKYNETSNPSVNVTILDTYDFDPEFLDDLDNFLTDC